MKKLLTAIAAAAFLIYPSICFSSYIIHLKDGREFATEQYWEEGDQIKFKRYGGVIGIQKDLVREIEEIEDVEELPEEKEKAEPAKEDVSQSAKKQGAEKEGKVKEGKEEVPEKVAKEQEKPGEVSEEEKKKAEQEKAAKIKAFLEERRRLMEERERVSSAFKEAKASNNRTQKDKYWNKLLRLQDQLAKLRNRVIADNEGKIPPWWNSAK